jgi:aryl-alcohol dehydrogenase-like predicted oxidoreductase
MQTSNPFDPAAGPAKPISRLGLGCSQVGSLGNPATPAQLRGLMRQAFDLGVTVFDTADIYGQGDSEREIGKALRDVRDRVFVITKFGKRFSPAMRVMRPFKPVLKPLLAARGAGAAVKARRDRVMRENFSPDWLRRALEASLRRLRFDQVDAVLLHSPPLEVFGDPGVAELFAALKTEGKLAHFGASCDDWADLEAALAIPGLTVLQLPLDVIDRAVETGLAASFAERGIAVFAREVIRLQPDLTPVAAVTAAAARQGVACVIAGTSRPAHLDQLAQALS